jgi:hypothetical protein
MVAAVIILRRRWCSGWSGWTGAREGEVGRCARPCRGGSNAGEKKGQHLAMEDYIAARQGGGWVTGDATRQWGGVPRPAAARPWRSLHCTRKGTQLVANQGRAGADRWAPASV